MNYKESTQILNVVFDTYLATLKPSEVLVLLVIIRQTVGWYDAKTHSRKKRDWISYGQFAKKTGLSTRTISKAVHVLVTSGLIEVTDKCRNLLDTPSKRKGKVGNYYRCLLYDRQNIPATKEKNSIHLKKNIPITKLTSTKLIKQKDKKSSNKIKRLSDTQRYQQIIQMIRK